MSDGRISKGNTLGELTARQELAWTSTPMPQGHLQRDLTSENICCRNVGPGSDRNMSKQEGKPTWRTRPARMYVRQRKAEEQCTWRKTSVGRQPRRTPVQVQHVRFGLHNRSRRWSSRPIGLYRDFWIGVIA